MTTGKTIALPRWTFVGKVMSLLFNMLSRLVMTFLPRSKHLLISWLLSPSAVILEPQRKSATVSTVYLSICHEVMGPDAMISVFWMLSFKLTFSLSSFTFIKRLFSSSLLSAVSVVHHLKNQHSKVLSQWCVPVHTFIMNMAFPNAGWHCALVLATQIPREALHLGMCLTDQSR